MITLDRNLRTFHYCLYDSEVPLYDEDNDESGETLITYAEAVAVRANISAATGSSQVEQFGNFISYDKVIVTDDINIPIDENTVLFVDKEPEYREIVTGTETVFDEELQKDVEKDVVVKLPLYDYIVKRVARSLNSVSIAISKVKVS